MPEARLAWLVLNIFGFWVAVCRFFLHGFRAVYTILIVPVPIWLRRRRIDRSPFPFLALPPEIRERIYEFHFRQTQIDAGIDAEGMIQEPPITLVSRLVRLESLPLFYPFCKVLINIGIHNNNHGCSRVDSETLTDRRYRDFPQQKLRHVQEYTFEFQSRIPSVDRIESIMSVHVKLDKKSGTYAVRAFPGFGCVFMEDETVVGGMTEGILDEIEEHVTSVVGRLAEEPGIGNWTARELDQVVDFRSKE